MRSVRSRLAVVLVPALLLPVVLAVLAIGLLGPRQQRTAADRMSEQTAAAVGFDLVEQCQSLGETARYLAQRLTAGDRPARAAATAIDRQRRAFAVVVTDGVARTSGAVPDVPLNQLVGLQCATQKGTGEMRGAVTGPPVIAQSIEATDVDGRPIGTVVVGRRLDTTTFKERLSQLSLTQGQDVALACAGGSGVSTSVVRSRQLRSAAATGRPSSLGTLQLASDRGRQGSPCAVAVGTPSTALVGPLGNLYGQGAVLPVALLLAVLLVGGVLVLRLASSLTDPVLALTQAAERVTRGDYTRRLPTGGRDELGRLSAAFNHMTEELQTKIGELERSRDLLRENVSRLGDTLQRTHDLDGLLTTVLQAAASATQAQRASAWLVEGESVVARVSVPSGRSHRSPVRRLPLGVDIAGEVAADGRARRLGHGHEDATTMLGGPTLAAPLRRANGVLGVVVVERAPAEPAFTSEDEAMLTSLAGPAGIAVDNVLLHREAQRLSVTDPLTGAGNLRHMTTTLAREVERSTRFDRPLSVLLLDLDHFKNVNDTYGHTVGDGVLRELAGRLAGVVREVDTVARYGGEEFVVVTPETDTEGAQRLAQRICETVREEPFRIGSDVVEVTVSVGVASLPMHGTASSDLVRAADEGLYAAKHAGRDQWQVAPGGGSRVGR